MIWVLIIFNVLLAIHCFYAWREVWGLRGGYGKGVWSEEEGGYLDMARERRRHTTLLLIIYTALVIGAWFE